MTRKKVKLAFITNDSARKATFKKRKKGLIKKVKELSTLCGISASAIIYSPYDSNPEVWPSNSDLQRVISEFRALSEIDQNKKMLDQESFLNQRLTKAFDNLKRQKKENIELEMTHIMFQSMLGNMGKFQMNLMDLNHLAYLIDRYLKDVNRRIENLQNSGMEIGESSNVVANDPEGGETMAVVAPTAAPPATTVEMGSSSSSLFTAGFFNHIQQHPSQQNPLLQSTTPPAGIYENPQNLHQNQNQQQWFMESRNQLQPQQFHGESSSTPAIVSSSSTTPTTDPCHVNNIWFR